ncbi:hypothetical protein GCM10009801_81300 [Streptomyces albiaxialis]|uniref:Uncharacterized protein n=1 Tax=Streptomyces albiaxialis TaxID=329523 RepID=A0ABP5IR91_9ACTN
MWNGYCPPSTGPITPTLGRAGKYAPRMMARARNASNEARAAETPRRIRTARLPRECGCGGVCGRERGWGSGGVVVGLGVGMAVLLLL